MSPSSEAAQAAARAQPRVTSAAPARVPADWPLRQLSMEVRSGHLHWHVQVAGQAHGPVLMLLHGTGASTHSWAALLPTLAQHATVLVPDLPGHGFTLGAQPQDMSLPGMAQALQGLLRALQLPAPQVLVGHSAGAALALRWVLDNASSAAGPSAAAPTVLGFAPSLVAPPATYTRWLAPLLNPVATSSLVAGLGARLAGGTRLVDSLLDSTGSTLSAGQRAHYRQLFTDPAHVRGAMGFMAAADLPGLLAASGAQRGAMGFVLGTRDSWIPESALAPVIAQHLPRAQVLRWRGGHLVHEEEPHAAADWVLSHLPWVPEEARRSGGGQRSWPSAPPR